MRRGQGISAKFQSLGAVLLALFACVGLTDRQTPLSPPTVFLGVVDIPKAFGTPDEVTAAADGSAPRKQFHINLRRQPDDASGTAVVVTDADAFGASDMMHPMRAASVYGRVNGWNLLRLTDGRTGWLAPNDSGSFESYEGLLRDMTDWSVVGEWDRMLAAAPGSPSRTRLPRDPRRAIVGLLQGTVKWQRVPYSQAAFDAVQMHSSRTLVRPDGSKVIEVDSGVVVPVFEQPSTTSRQLAEVETHRPGFALVVDRSNQPLVVKRMPGWNQVALAGGGSSYRQLHYAWIEARADAWSFHAVSPVEADRVASDVWDREDGPAVSIKEIRRVGRGLWLRVQVFYDSDCVRLLEDILEPRRIIAEGWLPAHDPSGRPLVWFETYCD